MSIKPKRRGRPPISERARRKGVEVTMLSSTMELLRKLGKGNLSQGIERSAEWYGLAVKLDAHTRYLEHLRHQLAFADELGLPPVKCERWKKTLRRGIEASENVIRTIVAEGLQS